MISEIFSCRKYIAWCDILRVVCFGKYTAAYDCIVLLLYKVLRRCHWSLLPGSWLDWWDTSFKESHCWAHSSGRASTICSSQRHAGGEPSSRGELWHKSRGGPRWQEEYLVYLYAISKQTILRPEVVPRQRWMERLHVDRPWLTQVSERMDSRCKEVCRYQRIQGCTVALQFLVAQVLPSLCIAVAYLLAWISWCVLSTNQNSMPKTIHTNVPKHEDSFEFAAGPSAPILYQTRQNPYRQTSYEFCSVARIRVSLQSKLWALELLQLALHFTKTTLLHL